MEESIVSFFEQWSEEFARAVEMFTGERPLIEQNPVDPAKRAQWQAELANYAWWRQTIEGGESFAAWAGAWEECATALGGAPDDGGDATQLFQEMLSQANQGAAAVLSASFPTPLRCQEGVVEAPPSLHGLELSEIVVTFRETALPAIILALQPSAAKILSGPEVSVSVGENRSAGPGPSALLPAVNSPMLNRLMDLHLPVSVLLGQAVLSIRDVLKITSGSLIELDRQIGDYVEVIVHGTVVARGEIVAIKGNYGVRIKEVISRQDRLALRDAA